MLTKKGKEKKLAKLQVKNLKRQTRKARLPPKKPRNRGGSVNQASETIWNQLHGRLNPKWGRFADFRASGEPIFYTKFELIKPHVPFKIDWRKEGF